MENKSLYKFIIGLGVTCFLFLALMFTINYYNTYYAENTSFNEEKIYLYIPTGSGLDNLKKQIFPLLKDSSTFFDAAYKKKYILNIKAGKYEIKKGFSNKEILNSLKFNNVPVKVTFNNVERLENLASRISKYIEADSLSLMNSFNEKLFLNTNNLNSESVFAIFLPNTYEFYWNTSADQFRDKMLYQYNLYWNNLRKQKARSLNLSPVEVSVLASIVQRETPKVDERPTISGVYFNRLKKRMKLQADPTVVYKIKEKKGFDKKIRRVLYRDLKIKSPYNTYVNAGLPPGPIAMPDISAIDAVLNAENHDYIYFCASPEKPGYHAFASNYSEHQVNARKYAAWVNKLGINR